MTKSYAETESSVGENSYIKRSNTCLYRFILVNQTKQHRLSLDIFIQFIFISLVFINHFLESKEHTERRLFTDKRDQNANS